MKRVVIAALLVGIVGFGATAVSVGGHWVGCSEYVISASGLPADNPNGYTSEFGFAQVDRSPWWLALADGDTMHHIIIENVVSTFDEVGIDIASIVLFESITISFPATWNGTTLITPGDSIMVFAGWIDEGVPVGTLTVGPCGGGSEAATPAPKVTLALVMNPPDENGVTTMTATFENTGDLAAMIDLSTLIYAVAPQNGWYPDTFADIFWYPNPKPEGTLVIEPGESMSATLPIPAAADAVKALANWSAYAADMYPQLETTQPMYLAVGFPYNVGSHVGHVWGWCPLVTP
jgi:hypothetical protein